jgi:hypothetical protein
MSDLEKLKHKYPNRVPVIVYQTPNFLKKHKLKKNKYLISIDTTVGAFIYHLKTINGLKSTDAFYLMIYNTPLQTSSTFGLLRYKFERDDALILTIDSESTFG